MLDSLPLDVFVHIFKVAEVEQRITIAERLLECRNRTVTGMIEHPDVLKVIFNKKGKRWRSFIKHPLLHRCILYNAINLFSIVQAQESRIKLRGNLLMVAANNNRPDIVRLLHRHYGVTLEDHEFISYFLSQLPIVSYGAIHLYDEGFRIRFTRRNRSLYLPTQFSKYLIQHLSVRPNSDITLHLASYTGRIQLINHIISRTNQLPIGFNECALLIQDTWTYTTLANLYPEHLQVDKGVIARMLYPSRYGFNPHHWSCSTISHVFRIVMEQMSFDDHVEMFHEMCQKTAGIGDYTSALNWFVPSLRLHDPNLMTFTDIAIDSNREDLLEYLLVHHGAHVSRETLEESDWVKAQWDNDTISDMVLDLLCQTGLIIQFICPSPLEKLIVWCSKRQHHRVRILMKYQMVSSFVKQCVAFYAALIDSANTGLIRPSASLYSLLIDTLV